VKNINYSATISTAFSASYYYYLSLTIKKSAKGPVFKHQQSVKIFATPKTEGISKPG